MKNEIYLFGEVGYEITLQRVIEAVKETDASKPLLVNIHSQGGSVYEGMAIYNYLKGLGREVNTASVGLVASIASVIFLAGKNRTLNHTAKFLIHLPSGGVQGNAEDFEKTAVELRKIENEIAGVYATETSLTAEEALALMKQDIFSDIEFLKEKGFATEIITLNAVATLNKSNLKNQKKMSKKMIVAKDANNLFAGLRQFINALMKPMNKIVTDANGVEIDFFEIEEDAEPQIGDKANVNNSPIEDSEVVMPNGETWVFVDGALSEIKSEGDQTQEEIIEELTTEVEELKEELGKKEEEIQNLKKTNATALAEIDKKIKMIEASMGSSFKYENKANPKKENQKTNERTFRRKY
jgi:ATP-dependent Clp protease, protease subunit